MTDQAPSSVHEMTADIVSAYVQHHTLSPADVPELIVRVYAALGGLGEAVVEAPEVPVKLTGAQIRKSITPAALISFEDGKSYKTLRRHLTTHGLTVDGYKAKWGLPDDYPSVAPDYSATRSAMAVKFGLGRKAAPIPVVKAKVSRAKKAPAEAPTTTSDDAAT